MPFDNLEPLPVEARILAVPPRSSARVGARVMAYDLGDGRLNFCALGALGAAQREIAPPPKELELHYRLKVAVMQHLPAKYPNIIRYNDAPGRTAEEVAQLFEKCATAAIMGVTEYAI